MNPEHDAAEQIINSATRIAVHSFEILSTAAAQGGLFLAQYLIAHIKQQHKTKGKTSIGNFKDKPTKVFIIKRQDLELFAREAKKYGVLYAAVMDKKNNDGLVDIIVNDVDAAKVNRIADRFAMGMEDVRRVQEEILQAQADIGDATSMAGPGHTAPNNETTEHEQAGQRSHQSQPQQNDDGTYSMSDAHLDAIFSDGEIDDELLDIEIPVEEFSLDENELDSLFIEDGEYSLDDSQLDMLLGDDENPTRAEMDKDARPSEQKSERNAASEIPNTTDDKSVKKRIQDKRQQRRENAVQPQPRIKNMKER